MELNGESRVLTVEDRSAAVEHVSREVADKGNPGSVGAPLAGAVVEIRVKEGSEVKTGDPLLVMSAMSECGIASWSKQQRGWCVTADARV